MTIRIRGNSTDSIDAQEINLKLGNSQTAELSFSAAEVGYLSGGDTETYSSTPGAIDFSSFKNKSLLTTATFFGSVGYDGDLPAGSLSDTVLASYNGGGYVWHGVSNNQNARWLKLYRTGAGQLRFQVSIGTGNTLIFSSTGANWGKVIIRRVSSGNLQVHEYPRGYAGFNTTGKYWYWNGVSTTIMGTTTGLKRYVSIK